MFVTGQMTDLGGRYCIRLFIFKLELGYISNIVIIIIIIIIIYICEASL